MICVCALTDATGRVTSQLRRGKFARYYVLGDDIIGEMSPQQPMAVCVCQWFVVAPAPCRFVALLLLQAMPIRRFYAYAYMYKVCMYEGCSNLGSFTLQTYVMLSALVRPCPCFVVFVVRCAGKRRLTARWYRVGTTAVASGAGLSSSIAPSAESRWI